MSQPIVAIVGSSTDRSKFGNKSVRAHQAAGYQVFPVNPRGGQIEGLSAYKSIDELPIANIDRVSMYVAPTIGIGMLAAIAQRECAELWLNPGTASAEMLDAAGKLGLNVIEDCSIVALGMSPNDFDDA